ncbi:MAG: peptidoglycan-binding domain-containing protein [Patescibacteria group bacterium]
MKYSKHLFILGISALAILAANTTYAASCGFTRDLSLNAEGEDVRCLQKFLNGSGYIISSTGAGSPGKETDTLKSLTVATIKKWQKDNGLASTGYFGPLSRQKYNIIVAGPSSSSQTLATPVVTTTTSSGSSSDAKSALTRAIKQLQDSEDEVVDSGHGGVNVDQSNKDLVSAREEILKAMKSYISGDYSKAKSYADNSFSDAVNAFKAAGGKTKGDSVDNRINEVDHGLDDIEDKINNADDGGKDVSEAKSLLKSARTILQNAKDELDALNYDDANNLAQEAEDKGSDAEDAINNNGDETDALNAINKAKSAMSAARSDISLADKKNRDTSDAKGLFNDATEFFNNARIKYDDEDYADAESLARKAERKAEDASDAL